MVTAKDEELKLIRCTAGTAVVGIEINRIAGIERGERLTRRPTDKAAGSLRTPAGEWTIVALSPTADVGRSAAGQVVLFYTPRGRFGLLVDHISAVERVSRTRITPIPAGVGPRVVARTSQVALSDSAPLLLLNTDTVGSPDGVALDESQDRSTASHAAARLDCIRPQARTDQLLMFGRVDYPRPGGRPVALAIPVDLVVEVYESLAGSQLLGAEDHIREVVLWRGKPLVVMDALRWVGLPGSLANYRRVVVARAGGHAVGFFAGTAVQILQGSVPCIEMRRPVALRRANVLAALDANDLTLIIPDWDKLLGARVCSEFA